MPKIRDLGINFIPATMRPLEIGPGVPIGDAEAGGHQGYWLGGPESTCEKPSCKGDKTDCPKPSCTPDTSTCCKPSCRSISAQEKHNAQAYGLDPDAIIQLEQQLDTWIGSTLTN